MTRAQEAWEGRKEANATFLHWITEAQSSLDLTYSVCTLTHSHTPAHTGGSYCWHFVFWLRVKEFNQSGCGIFKCGCCICKSASVCLYLGLSLRLVGGSLLFSHIKPTFIKLPLFVSSQAPVNEMETSSLQGKRTKRTAIYGM